MKYATDAMKESRIPDFLASVGALIVLMDTANFVNCKIFLFLWAKCNFFIMMVQ